MKKSVVILILVIYLASIALVSFFGLDFKIFEEVIYVEKIEILNKGLKHNDTWGDYVVITPDSEGALRYKIDYRVYPDEATNQDVSFAFDSQATGVTVTDSGLVEFESPGMIKVKVVSTDGTNVEAAITIIAKNK